jgi:hypothetical protein
MMLSGIHKVDGLVATLEAVLYEWQQNPVLFLGAVKERTNMADLAQLGSGERDGRQSFPHSVFSPSGCTT